MIGLGQCGMYTMEYYPALKKDERHTHTQKNLNIRPETIKLLADNTGEKLLDSDLGDDFLYTTSKVQIQKQR